MKIMKFYKIIVLTTISLLFFTCKNKIKEESIDLGYAYYPLEIGYEWVYNVQSIAYNVLKNDTTKYQLKEVVKELVPGGDEENYLLYRYKRVDEVAFWSLDSIWSVKKEQGYLVKTENNIRYQKLKFGTSLGLTWDGNIWNTKAENNYTIVKLETPYTLKGKTYNKVLEIEQYVDKNLILSIANKEVYAKEIGLIEVYKENLETQPMSKSLGSVYHQTLVSFKN